MTSALPDEILGWDAGVIAVFYAYFDESGTHAREVTLLGGCVATDHQWTLLHYQWNQLLEAHGIERYHARELGWNSKVNQSFIKAALPLIEKETEFSVTVALRNAEHNDYKKAPGVKQYHHSHYGLCFHIAMVGVVRFMTDKHADEQASFVMSDGDPHAGDALRIFQAMKDGKIRGRETYLAKNLGGITFKSDLFGLQVADLISGVAYHDLLDGKFKTTGKGPQRRQRVLLDARWYAQARGGLTEMQEAKRRYQESRRKPAA